jgi:hypothetical protein
MPLSQVSGLLEIKFALGFADGCVSECWEKMDVDSGADDDHILVVNYDTKSDDRNGDVLCMNVLCGEGRKGHRCGWWR